ncbi:MAG: hypothetical protein HQM09_04665 [Candidatus Riflebacteria bacterium]|nr:hypothetical protein [Candidatus Riflebacteria bacterium]
MRSTLRGARVTVVGAIMLAASLGVGGGAVLFADPSAESSAERDGGQTAAHKSKSTGKGAKKAVREIKSDLSQATDIPPERPYLLAADLFRRAFNGAITLTQPSYPVARREEGYALASRCLHPSLFSEVGMAIDTYFKLFPNGKHRNEVMVNKALLDYAEGRLEDGRAAIAAVAASSRGKERGHLLALQLDGLLSSGHFRLAGSLLDEILADKSGIDRKSVARFRNDRDRFEHGAILAEKALKDITTSQRDPEYAAAALRSILDDVWFAPKAPDASLLVLALEDSAKPLIHGCEVHLLGKQRANFHRMPAFRRVENLETFLKQFPDADPEMRGRVLIQIHGIHTYEMMDAEAATYDLERLAGLASFSDRVSLEALLGSLQEARLGTPETNDRLLKLDTLSRLFPWDDGYNPIIASDDVTLWRAWSELAAGNIDTLTDIITRIPMSEKIHSIPLKLIMQIAGNNKDDAWVLYGEIEKMLSAHDNMFVRDFLFPLYKPVSEHDRGILTAAALSAKFPKEAVDILLKVLTAMPSEKTNHHALALLAELYQSHHDYVEGQAVWSRLGALYPNSRWLH